MNISSSSSSKKKKQQASSSSSTVTTSALGRRRWSPLTCLPTASLTPSGLLQLDVNDGEVELLSSYSRGRANVELRSGNADPLPPPPPTRVRGGGGGGGGNDDDDDDDAIFTMLPLGDWIDRDVGLDCVLTTHRIVLLREEEEETGRYFDDDSNNDNKGGKNKKKTIVNARFIHLSMIVSAELAGGKSQFSFSSPKISLATYSYGELLLIFRPASSSSSSSSAAAPYKIRDEYYQTLQRALTRKGWEESTRLQQKRTEGTIGQVTKRKVGVDAILTKNQLQHQHATKLASDVFEQNDIELLMKEAAELVGIIRKYVATLEREEEKKKRLDYIAGGSSSSLKTDDAGGSLDDGEDDDEDRKRLTDMLEDMGMMNAVQYNPKHQQKSDKVLFYRTLARQIADFLLYKNRLKEAGGMMSLTDVYCLYNRARGTNMISPDDLLRAIDQMKILNLGVSKREFPSGVLIIQDDTFDDVTMANKLRDLANQSLGVGVKKKNEKKEKKKGGGGLGVNVGGVTVLDVCKALKISAMLANEQLLSAERMGYLCRDVTLEGTRFFPNKFVTGEFD